MAINTFGFPTPQAFSGGVDFSPLANLGNVYRQGQQNRLADLAFSQMGTDPAANAQLLIKSGHPDLVPLGVKMQQALETQKERVREFGITSEREQQALDLERQKFEQGKPTTAQQRYDILKSQVDAGHLPPDYLDRPEVQAHIASGQALPQPIETEGAKEQAKRTSRYNWARQAGYSEDESQYFAGTGKFPKEDLSAHEQTIIDNNQKALSAANDVKTNLARMKEISPEAWSGWGAKKRADVVNAILPDSLIPTGALNAEELSQRGLLNVAGQLKATFGNRLNIPEMKLLTEIETTPNMSRSERLLKMNAVDQMMDRHIKDLQDESNAIRNKTYRIGSPGGMAAPPPQAAPIGAPAQPTAPPTAPSSLPTGPQRAAPSLSEWMTAAREANPGVGDSELAREWKRKYGGGEKRAIAGGPAPPISQ